MLFFLSQDSLGVYYAIFDLISTQIQVLCHSSDEQLPFALQAHYDLFRGPSEEPRGQYISTISNCPFQLQGITNYSEALINSAQINFLQLPMVKTFIRRSN